MFIFKCFPMSFGIFFDAFPCLFDMVLVRFNVFQCVFCVFFSVFDCFTCNNNRTHSANPFAQGVHEMLKATQGGDMLRTL